MSYRTLDRIEGQGGGAQQLARHAKHPRSIHITVINLDQVNPHCAFFARSRRELGVSATGVQQGFALPVAPATAPAAGNGIQYAPGAGFFTNTDPQGNAAKVYVSSFVLTGWAGELWAVADAPNAVQVDVFDSAVTEV